MPISNYNGGFMNGVTIRGVPIVQLFPGKVFYVNNSSVTTVDGVAGSNSNKGTYQRPFSTLGYAITQCKANRGDIICLLPGFSSSIAAADAIDMDIAGVAVVGLGYGTKKATITFSAAAATIAVTANNCAFVNCVFSANFADIATAIDCSTAKYLTLVDVDFVDTATNMNFLYCVDTNATANAADGMYLERVRWISPDLACVSMVKVDAALDNIKFDDCYANLGVNNSTGAFYAAGANNVTNLRMDGCGVYRLNTTNTGALLSTTSTASSGIISNCYAQMADGTNNLMLPASTKIATFNNYYTGALGASGFLNPVADT